MLDESFLVSVSREVGTLQLNLFLTMCSDIGLPMAPEIFFPPDTTMSFLGYEIDSLAQEVRLPLDKLGKCAQEIQNLLQKNKASLRELQSVIGLLNFTFAVVLPGRPFLRRLIDLTIGVAAPHFKIRLNKGAKEDLTVWLQFLIQHNGRCLFLDQQPVYSPDMALYTDASGSVGYGAICGSEWFNGEWSP